MSVKKVLLILELEGTLMMTRPRNAKLRTFGNTELVLPEAPDAQTPKLDLYYRRGRVELLSTLFTMQNPFYEVAVWSCLDRESTEVLSKKYFDRHYRKLLFVSATSTEDYLTPSQRKFQDEAGRKSMAIDRNLGPMFERFNDYNPSNTIMVSPFRNLNDNYAENDLFMQNFAIGQQGYKFVADFNLVV
jgi:hypothetical protein